MPRFGLLIDMSRCNGCYGCFMACRDEFCGNDHLPYSAAQPYSGHFWMRVIERERGSYPKVKTSYLKVPCMHCDDAPCVTQHPDKVYSRPDGIVIIDPVKATGSKEILDSCPYRAIFWNEERSLPQKCTLCAHLLDRGWKEPRCVEVCPTKALLFGDLDDPESEVSKRLAEENAEVLHPEYGLKEKVWYLNMPKRFIAGSLVFGDTDECARDVVVTLLGEGRKKQVKSSGFGDFEFEGLDKDKKYSIEIRHPGYRDKELIIYTPIDKYLGDIVLEKV
ncbi:MAG: 4Fe-4S dicluster domain-containing protein [bacterium]